MRLLRTQRTTIADERMQVWSEETTYTRIDIRFCACASDSVMDSVDFTYKLRARDCIQFGVRVTACALQIECDRMEGNTSLRVRFVQLSIYKERKLTTKHAARNQLAAAGVPVHNVQTNVQQSITFTRKVEMRLDRLRQTNSI